MVHTLTILSSDWSRQLSGSQPVLSNRQKVLFYGRRSALGEHREESGAQELGVGVELKTKIREDFTITEKVPTTTRAFSWLKAATTTFTFKTLC